MTIIPLLVWLSACGSIPEQSGALTGSRYSNQPVNQASSVAPTTQLSPAAFNSSLAAVLAATQQYNSLSIAQDREFIGAILRHKGEYRYTVGQGRSSEDTVSVRLTLPKGAKIVAFWHTHRAEGHGRKYCSVVDTALVKSWNKPFYMADASGTLRVFNPGDDTLGAMQARRLGLGDHAGYAKGVIVNG